MASCGVVREGRGYQRDPGGGLMEDAVPSEPLPFAEILRSRVVLPRPQPNREFQSTIFQPVGGEYGAQIHPQYQTDYENGIAVGWHRAPGCSAALAGGPEEARKQYYKNLCQIDGRIVLPGSTAPTCRPGKRVLFCPRSTRSRDCTSAWWRADHAIRISRQDLDHMAGMALAMVLTGAAASAAGAQSSDGSFSSSRRFMQHDGEVIYRTVCQGCHMVEARGAVEAGAYPALAKDAKLAAAGYPVLVVVNGSKACRLSAHCSMMSRWRRWSTTSALILATLTRTAYRRPM
jgi:mono/diheme cytochrome c family protein